MKSIDQLQTEPMLIGYTKLKQHLSVLKTEQKELRPYQEVYDKLLWAIKRLELMQSKADTVELKIWEAKIDALFWVLERS